MPDVAAQLRDLVERADAGELPDVIAALAGAHALALSRLLAPTVPATEGLVDAVKMAELLDVPENWIRDAARSERIPSQRLGHYVRFNPAEVLAAVRKLPPSHNGRLCTAKKAVESRGGRRPVSKECPNLPTEIGHA